jgi:hypothetical protein
VRSHTRIPCLDFDARGDRCKKWPRSRDRPHGSPEFSRLKAINDRLPGGRLWVSSIRCRVAAPQLADATRCALEELARDDIERDAFAGELDAVRVAQPVRRAAPPHARLGGKAMNRRGPRPSTRSHGGESRRKAARFPARTTLEEFDFTFQPSVKRQIVEHIGQLDFLHGRENIVLVGRPAPAKHIWRSRSRSAPDSPATASSSQRPPSASRAWPRPNATTPSTKSCAGCRSSRCSSSTESDTSRQSRPES